MSYYDFNGDQRRILSLTTQVTKKCSKFEPSKVKKCCAIIKNEDKCFVLLAQAYAHLVTKAKTLKAKGPFEGQGYSLWLCFCTRNLILTRNNKCFHSLK
jgi:hypothetical protein